MSATRGCPTPFIINSLAYAVGYVIAMVLACSLLVIAGVGVDKLAFAIGYFIIVMLAFGVLVIVGIAGFLGLWFIWNFVKVAFNRASNGRGDADESYNVVPTKEDI